MSATGRRSEKPFLEDGVMVGRYRVVNRIGAGSMGEVYLAVDEQLGRRAAIKVLGSRHVGNPTIQERFLREARALARLSHPNLTTVFEAGHVGEGQRPYFAMELLEGGDTQKLIDERGPLPGGVVAHIGAQAAAGLGEAARAAVIHRDVKPANLGLSRQGIVKVTDFGLAKSYAAEKSLTGDGFVVGTADYIAPEQARGEDLDERADVYALGCTLFHLLTGLPPFRAEDGTQVQRYVAVMRAHLTSPVPDPRAHVAGADDELSDYVMKLMAKDRDRRPTFDEAAPALARQGARLGGTLPRVTKKVFTLPTGIPVLSAAESAATAQFRAAVRPRWPRIVLMAVAVLGAVAVALAFLRR